jgi:hypothetical protein
LRFVRYALLVRREQRPAVPVDQARRLPRYLDLQAERVAFERKLARILLELDAELPKDAKPINGAGGGEPARLRGLPAIGRNVSGAVPGTDPLKALLAKERRQRRR